MGISVRYGRFQSPMRVSFKHASADRNETQSVIVAISDDQGRVGYGEGCPREYVTGESSSSVASFLQQYGVEAANAAESLEAFQHWSESHRKLIDDNPSAFCALELAVLDWLGKRANVDVETLLGLPPLTAPVEYSAIIGDCSPANMLLVGLIYRLYGFSDFKVKLSGEVQRENRRLAALPSSATVRFDANNLWVDADACVAYCRQLKCHYWAIEEPVGAFDVEALKAIAKELNTRVILDESCLREEHVAPFIDNATSFIANIRVSKCGGILRSIELANYCLSNGIDVILGAHVGETSLLTRSAMVVAQGMLKRPLAREGAFGRILLKHDIADTSLQFGRGGVLQVKDYGLRHKHGLGIEVDPKSLDIGLTCL